VIPGAIREISAFLPEMLFQRGADPVGLRIYGSKGEENVHLALEDEIARAIRMEITIFNKGGRST
jgi:hypothetical protein